MKLVVDTDWRPMVLEATRLAQLLGQVTAYPPRRFSGLGLILYVAPLDLPTTPLVPDVRRIADLPMDFDEGVRLLGGLADQTGPFHDGFHLVDAERMTLTHICQYVAPPIPARLPHRHLAHSVGARHMTALLASLMPGVALAATMHANGEISVFDDGVVTNFDLDRADEGPLRSTRMS